MRNKMQQTPEQVIKGDIYPNLYEQKATFAMSQLRTIAFCAPKTRTTPTHQDTQSNTQC